MVSSTCRVGIVGAGTTGVYLASLLTQQGYHVDIFEKAPAPRTDGCGILLVQAGMKALFAGNSALCEQMISVGVPVRNFEFRNLRGGVVNAESVSYESGELPGLLIHRTAILETLLSFVPSDCLHFNADFKSLTQTEQGVTVEFQDGKQWEGDLLVGVDGIFSKVREFVVPGVELFYLGDLVWRGVVPDDDFCPEGSFILYVRGRGIYANFFSIGEGRTHWGFFIEKDQIESPGKPCPVDITIPAEELAKLPEPASSVIASTPLEQMICRYSFDIEPLPQLYQGRVLLMGDAAHAKSPTRARGMTAGFEDALALSRHLVAAPDVATALAEFEAERMPIVHEYQRTSREISLKIGRGRKREKEAA